MNLRRTLREQRQENATRAAQSEQTARLSLRGLQSENQKLLEENQRIRGELRKQQSTILKLTNELQTARSRNQELRSMNGSLLALLNPDEQTKVRELANIRLEIKQLQSGKEGTSPNPQPGS